MGKDKAKVVMKENKDFPKGPSIAVYAGKGGFGTGHARIFIAVEQPPGTMKYYTTDLQGQGNKIAAIYIKKADSWADPARSRTWSIPNEKALDALTKAVMLRSLNERVKNNTDILEHGRVKGNIIYGGFMDSLGYINTCDTHGSKEGTKRILKNEHSKYKMDKNYSYYTCATYARQILLAAGVPSNSFLWGTTGINLVKRDNIFTGLITLLKEK